MESHGLRSAAPILLAGMVVLVGARATASETRLDFMFDLGRALKEVAEGVPGGSFPNDGGPLVVRASRLAEMSRRLTSFFPAGAAERAGSRASPDIWNSWPAFTIAAEELVGAADQAVDAANAGNAEALRKAIVAAGYSCSACHLRFRVER